LPSVKEVFSRAPAAHRRPLRLHGRHAGSSTARAKVWLFDLDNTLHNASHAIFAAIDTRMTDYVALHLALERGDADSLRRLYWQRYGATLLGMVRHHGVDARHFLRETHDFEVARLLRAERGLVRALARLPGRKILITNAPLAYATTVLRGLAVHRHFRDRYPIERMQVHRVYRPKPSRLMLRALLARERVAAADAVLIEDSAVNLKAARQLGVSTVLMTGHGTPLAGAPGRRARAGYVGLRIRTLHALPRAAGRIRR
jgi:putative hydrolase of the HAD superfamily